VVSSWIGKGENLPISGEQLSSVLGSEALSELAAKAGLDSHALAGQLASVLPGVVDHLTPAGEVPAAGRAVAVICWVSWAVHSRANTGFSFYSSFTVKGPFNLGVKGPFSTIEP